MTIGLDTLIVSLVFLLVFVCLYFILFKVLKIPDSIRDENSHDKTLRAFWEYTGNYVSLIHAIISIGLGSYIIFSYELSYFAKNRSVEVNILAVSFAYFVVDTIIGLSFGFNDIAMLAHHFMSIVMIGYPILKGQYANIMIWGLIMGEISNPFMLTWKNLKTEGKKEISTVFGILFAIIFILFRTYFLGTIAWPLFSLKVTLILKLSTGGLWFLSLHWVWIIINSFTKEMYNSTKNKVFGSILRFLTILRKSIIFKVLFYSLLFYICFFQTIYKWNHPSIF